MTYWSRLHKSSVRKMCQVILTISKSGAGQYFTPRVLINIMTQLVAPQPGERCNDANWSVTIQQCVPVQGLEAA